jgi:hypothetical protein
MSEEIPSFESFVEVQLEAAEGAALEAELLERFAATAATLESLVQSALEHPERLAELDLETRRWLASRLDAHIAWTDRLLEEWKL